MCHNNNNNNNNNSNLKKIKKNNNNNNNTWDNVYGAVILSDTDTSHFESSPCSQSSSNLMNVEQRQAAADPRTKPTDFCCRPVRLYRLQLFTSTIAIYYYSARNVIIIYRLRCIRVSCCMVSDIVCINGEH